MPPQQGGGCCVSCSIERERGERRPEKERQKGRLIGLLIVEPHKKGEGNWEETRERID